jgi:uncharacterized Tic20 family protein
MGHERKGRNSLGRTSTTESGTPFEGVSATPQPLSVRDDRALATLSHFGGVAGCLPSAVIYATVRQRGRFTAQESREALNFTLLPTILIIACIGLSVIPAIGWLFGLAAALLWLYVTVMSLIAGVVVNRGNPYQYRLNTRLLDKFSRDA